LSGFLGALALAAFVAATLARVRERTHQDDAKRLVAKVDVFEKGKIHYA
jgi:hypothetical protein